MRGSAPFGPEAADNRPRLGGDAGVGAARAGRLTSGVLSAARQFGGAIGVALLGALIADSAHFMTGMRISLVVGAAVLVATTLGVALFLPGSPKSAASSTPVPGTEEPATVSLRPGGLESTGGTVAGASALADD
ncbi:hypothetical protein [Streptomyces sp. NPDC051286]|uniref:hypothetical protein n=1 Tax=Streptomyces sp. NPDC051286 TaxID=3365647 RepID=UPI0037AEE384